LPASAAVVVLSLAPCTVRQQIETILFALAPATIAIAALSANGILQMSISLFIGIESKNKTLSREVLLKGKA
jgi:hypothetical protein